MLLFSLGRNPDFLLATSSWHPTPDNYRDVLGAGSFHILAYLRNSVIVSAASAVLVTIIAGFSGYALTRLKFPGRRVIPVALLAISMFPQISIVGYLYKLMTSMNWINTYQALIFPYTAIALPLAIWLMMSYLSQIPRDLDNAALIDGATRLQILRRVIIPVAAPGVFSTLIIAFILCFNEFMFALILTVDFSARTIPVGIALFTGLHGQIPYGQIMAAAVVAIAPVIVLTALFQRRIIQGLAGGAIKG
ncbi:MAG: carbohydrate ABC transporter permease [Candidatus Zixiibacteriota bacterium]|nr:MAG: carbohydrate ABC transporter permease [candidate division Zixibacteria bacterium]